MTAGYRVTREAQFSAAHRLRDYDGPCEQLHGHNWRVQVSVVRSTLDARGMVMDFGDLGRIIKQVIDQLDHSMLNELEPFTACNPTSENIARYIYDQVATHLADPELSVSSVDVWETDRSRATYGTL